MPPKPRNTRNTGHPKGWRWKNGASTEAMTNQRKSEGIE
jgi:hypothetical protein